MGCNYIFYRLWYFFIAFLHLLIQLQRLHYCSLVALKESLESDTYILVFELATLVVAILLEELVLKALFNLLVVMVVRVRQNRARLSLLQFSELLLGMFDEQLTHGVRSFRMVESDLDARIRLALGHGHLGRNGLWPEAVLRRRGLSLSVRVVAVVRSGSFRRPFKVGLAEVVQLDERKLRLFIVDGIFNARIDADLDLGSSLLCVVLLGLLVRLLCLLESFLVSLGGFSTRLIGLEHNTRLSECNTAHGSVDVLDEVSG